MTTFDLLIQHCVFLATAPDDVLNSDVAIRQLEDAVHGINQLSAEDRAQLRSNIGSRLSIASSAEVGALEELASQIE